jgi:hypothetical protein
VDDLQKVVPGEEPREGAEAAGRDVDDFLVATGTETDLRPVGDVLAKRVRVGFRHHAVDEFPAVRFDHARAKPTET